MNSSTARTWNKNDGRMLPINLLSGSCWDMFLTLLCLTCPEIPITYSEGAGLSHINQNQANAPQICSQANLIREISKLRPSQITQDWVKLVVEANQRGGSSLRGWIWPSNALPMSEKKAPSFTKGKVHYTPLFYALSVSLDGGTPCRQGGCDVASVPDTSTSSCHSSPLLVPLSHSHARSQSFCLCKSLPWAISSVLAYRSYIQEEISATILASVIQNYDAGGEYQVKAKEWGESDRWAQNLLESSRWTRHLMRPASTVGRP